MTAVAAPIILESEFSDLRLDIDPSTGAPRRLWNSSTANDGIDLDCSVVIVSGGTERYGAIDGGQYPPYGLWYAGTEDVRLAGDGITQVRARGSATARVFSVDVDTTRADLWSVTWVYRFSQDTPRLAVDLQVRAMSLDSIARDVKLKIDAGFGDTSEWSVQSPGNKLRPDLPLDQLLRPVAVSTPGGLAGSAGLVAFERLHDSRSFILWPFPKTEIGTVLLESTTAGISLDWATDLAGQPGVGEALVCSSLHLDLLHEPFSSYLERLPRTLERLGIRSQGAPPDWAAGANIYEVQTGFSVFGPSFRYSPYPELSDLIGDLDRIGGLGFDTVQLMPRMPYPNYTVHDYADITTTYGDEAQVRRLVDEAHARGMRVILDVLLHGVVDGEVVSAVADGIRAGPFAERPVEPLPDMMVLDLDEADDAAMSWSQYVLDLEPFAVRDAPHRHPLLDAHPEWFCRNTAGEVIGIYTRAFDVAHPGWQRYFIDSLLAFIERLDVDGFRLDAPTYNNFHNWSERARTDAAASMLGCLPLFERLRVELKAVRPDVLLYTEPSGVLLRQSMDVVYNYDEQWLVRAVLTGGAGREQWVRNAHELGRWFAQRDASLPPGALTASHVDSHDTFWWPDPSQKWRRDQWGTGATAAMMATLALSGGPFMTFVGGEDGIEDQVRAVNHLRRERSEFADGESDYEAIAVDDERVYAVLRRSSSGSGLLLVNLSDTELRVRCRLDAGAVGEGVSMVTTSDALGGAPVEWQQRSGTWEATVSFEPFRAIAIVLQDGAHSTT